VVTLTRHQRKEDKFVPSQQSSRYTQPFRIGRFSTESFASPPIPISSVAVIAFLALQVGMTHAFVLLGGFVRPRPIAVNILR
jgi:hypothetical protein